MAVTAALLLLIGGIYYGAFREPRQVELWDSCADSLERGADTCRGATREGGLDAEATSAAAFWALLGRAPLAGEVSGPAFRPQLGTRRVVRSGDAGIAPDIQAIICGPYEWAWLDYESGCQWATRVVWCESSGNPLAYNPVGPYVGWWQVLNGPYDPYLNTVEANIQFVEWTGPDAWRVVSPWPACGSVKPW